MTRIGKLLRILVRPAYARCLFRGVAPAVEHESVLSSLNPRTVLDVGANRGQFAAIAARLWPKARIHSFEPLERPALRFQRLFKGVDRVTLHRVAIGTEPGSATMHVSRRDDSSSLLPISPRQTEVFPGTEEVGTETVKVESLEALVSGEELQGPVLMKIDVQGFELEVLKASEALLPRVDTVYVECSYVPLYEGQALGEEVRRFLEAHGFEGGDPHNETRDGSGTLIQADLMFRRRKGEANA